MARANTVASPARTPLAQSCAESGKAETSEAINENTDSHKTPSRWKPDHYPRICLRALCVLCGFSYPDPT